jgi:hypothetical protein
MKKLLVVFGLSARLLHAADVVATVPCCGQKPFYTDAAYAPFTGQVAVVTYEQVPSSPFVLSIVDLKAITATNPPRNTNYVPPVYNNAAWTVSKLGGIFGVTLDSAGNIYVAATTLYATKSVGIGGGYGSVYKIANGTGAVSVLANLPASPVGSLNPAGLGNLAYDCNSRTLFVSDLDNGLIYQLDPNSGAILATWDHGLHLGAPIPDDPSKTFTPPGRRVFAVRPFNGRLYFSDVWENSNFPDAAHNNAIWSVGLNTSGAGFSGGEQLEKVMPPIQSNWSNPVTDINVGPTGKFLVSERSVSGAFMGVWAHASRTIEFSGPPLWTPSSTFRNNVPANVGDSNAGSADYDFANTGNLGVWIMADALSFNPDVYGIQGTPSTGGDVTNSVLIDVSGTTTSQNKTQLGSVDIPCPSCVKLDLGITGPDRACQSPAQYCVTGVPTGSTVTWSVTGGTFTPAGANCVNVNWNPAGPYSITVTVAQPNGCKSTFTRTVAPCIVCCDTTMKASPVSIVPRTGTNYDVTTALTTPSGFGPIQRVTATIVSTTDAISPASCGPSGPVSSYMASALSSGTFVSFLPPFWREVKWTTFSPAVLTGQNFTFQIVVPPLPSGDCFDAVRFCVRWEFTNKDCRVCEVVTCYTLRRGVPVSDPRLDDTLKPNPD